MKDHAHLSCVMLLREAEARSWFPRPCWGKSARAQRLRGEAWERARETGMNALSLPEIDLPVLTNPT